MVPSVPQSGSAHADRAFPQDHYPEVACRAIRYCFNLQPAYAIEVSQQKWYNISTALVSTEQVGTRRADGRTEVELIVLVSILWRLVGAADHVNKISAIFHDERICHTMRDQHWSAQPAQRFSIACLLA